MSEERKVEEIVLVGGPGDGSRHQWKGGDLLRWIPKTPIEAEAVARAGWAGNPELHQFYYRRSMRTRSKFVFQP